MKIKLKVFLLLVFIYSNLFGTGAYDQGRSAGKGNLDISITWNPFYYFDQGQSYVVLGYGLNDKVDIHGYYSHLKDNNDNYYGGILYQFYKTERLDISTAFGIRKYTKKKTTHFFIPQLLYTIKLSEKINFGGNFVDIRNKNLKLSEGVATDLFFSYKFYESEKHEINLSVGAFKPVLWKPEYGNWYPTYSLDIKIK